MLSFEQCKKVLLANGGNYTNEQIKAIIECLYKLAHIEYEASKKSNN